MPSHQFTRIKGEFVRFSFSSELLENQIGDPLEREVLVYQPVQSDEPLPCIIALAAYTNGGLKYANWRAFSESLPQRIDRLVDEGKMGPCIVVMPDTFTSLGGNQFIDSEIMGDWGAWLSTDLISELRSKFKIYAFGLTGFSSGGYGAMVRGMLDSCWKAIVCHSGDCGFELVYASGMAEGLTHITKHGGVQTFIEYTKNSNKLSSDDIHALMLCAMAASYDGVDGISLPVDPHSCDIDEERWSRWMQWDPLTMIEDHRTWPKTFIDVGDKDQYHIQYGLRKLHQKLLDYEIEHTYEEFDGTHSGVEYRMDFSLPWLYAQLTD